MSELVLSLFPGIGLLDQAFEEHGFCIVRGPDLLWGGDIKRFHPPAGRFDGVVGGPPCQAFSRLRHMVVHVHGADRVAENLIPEFERCVGEARPRWFLMENVPDAPMPYVDGYAVSDLILNNRWVGGVQQRTRRFSFGLLGDHGIDLARFVQVELLEPVEWAPAVLASGCYRWDAVRLGRNGKQKCARMSELGYISKRGFADSLRLQGLPDDFLKDAPFTVAGKQKAVGNGVPLPMGRAVAKAVRAALEVLGQL